MTRKRILFLYGGFLVLLLVGTYVVLLQTGVSQTFVENVLARFLVRDRFRLRNANVDLGGGTVTIRGLEVRGGEATGNGTRLAVDTVEVGVSTNPLGEVGTVRRIKAEGLHLRLDLSAGKAPDLSEFLLLSEEPVGAAEDTRLPPIQILDSTITLRISPAGEPLEFTDVELELLPEEPDSPHVVLSGTMLAPNGVTVAVSGGGDVSKPEFHGLLELANVPLRPDIAKPYSDSLVEFLREMDIAGDARKLSLWMQFQGGGDRPVTEEEIVAGLNLDVDEVTCRIPQVPYPLVGASARISATTRAGGTVKFRLDNRSVDGDMAFRGTISNVFEGRPIADVRISARGILVSPTLGQALLTQPETRRIWKAFEPNGGRVDAEIHLRNATAGEPLAASMDLDLHGVGARYVGFENRDGDRQFGFPLPLTDLRGRIQLRRGTVHIRDIEAVSADGPMRIGGSIVTGRDEPPQIDLHIDSTGLRFSPQIRSALAVVLPGLEDVYDGYAPSGESAVDVQLRFNTTQGSTGAFVRLNPLGCSATYSGFPYRVDDIRGVIDITPEGVTFDLEGDREQCHVVVDGRFLRDDPESGQLDSELWVRARRLSLDADLRVALDALNPQIGRICDFLGIEVDAGCELSLWRDQRQSEFSYDMRLDLTGGAAVLENLRVPIIGVHGPVFIHGTGSRSRIDVNAVRGGIENLPGEEPASVLVQGNVHVDDGGYSLDVTSVVRNLQLTDELGEAMDQNGTFKLTTWKVLQPAGFVDAISRQIRRDGQKDIEHRLRLQLRDVSSNATILPGPATAMNGEVVVESGVAEFQDIRGNMVGAEFVCTNGSAWHEAGASMFAVTVSSDAFPVDDRLANLMTGPIRETYLNRDISGSMKIERLGLEFRFPDGAKTFEVALKDSSFVARDVTLTLGTKIQDVDGHWSVQSGVIRPAGGRIEGAIENGALTILNHRASAISGSFRADAESVSLSDVEGRLHNGRLFGIPEGDAPDLVYEFERPGRLRFALGWDGVSLSQLLRRSGVEGDRYRGNLVGRFRLDELVGSDFVEMKGSGELQITEGHLGEVPVFTAIYSYLTPRRRPRFDSASLRARVGDRTIDVERVELRSPLLTAEGSGTVEMDGYIRLSIDFPDFFGRAADWLVLPQVLRFITSRVVQFDIYGYLRNPRARPRWLWQDEPNRLPLRPVPAFRPRRKLGGR